MFFFINLYYVILKISYSGCIPRCFFLYFLLWG